MSDFDTSLDPQRMEGTLSDRQMAVRDVFVNEYFKDNDPFRACIRMGFMATFAVEQAKAFMNDGYVLRKIAFITSQSVQPSEEDKAIMLANLRGLSLNPGVSSSTREKATMSYMAAQGYIKKDEDGAIAGAEALAAVLSNFGKIAPA